MFASCPACSKRYAQLVNPACVICSGRGVIQLGEAALAHNEPEVVARAIVIALEAEARDIELKVEFGDDRLKQLAGTVGLLRASGILGPVVARQRAPRRLNAQALAAELTDVPIRNSDELLAYADPHEYRATDRPNARGLPLLSASGHPSHLARITDPAELGGSTSKTVITRLSHKRAATTLVAAAPEAVRIRKRNHGAD